jgi:deoxyribodipyrimidine photo-lyase
LNKEINIFWFRRDLRLDDNTALFHALSHKNEVLPIFIYDDNILSKLNVNDHRLHFIKESIDNLNLTLSKSKKIIICYRGKTTKNI